MRMTMMMMMMMEKTSARILKPLYAFFQPNAGIRPLVGSGSIGNPFGPVLATNNILRKTSSKLQLP